MTLKEIERERDERVERDSTTTVDKDNVLERFSSNTKDKKIDLGVRIVI